MSDLFNAFGPNNRSCPVCHRVGTLTGERYDGGTLECTGGMAPGRSADLAKGGCCASFTYRANYPTGPTLERIDIEQWNQGARLADDFHCSSCGARGWRSLCPSCERAA